MSSKAPNKAQNAISPTRAEDFAGWYQEVVNQAEIAEMGARAWLYGDSPMGICDMERFPGALKTFSIEAMMSGVGGTWEVFK
jgi:hypothetical protein